MCARWGPEWTPSGIYSNGSSSHPLSNHPITYLNNIYHPSAPSARSKKTKQTVGVHRAQGLGSISICLPDAMTSLGLLLCVQSRSRVP